MADKDFSNQAWYQFLTPEQQSSVQISFSLKEFAQKHPHLDDYSYIVFPMARAYEGFLKKYLYEQKLIEKHVYEGRRFRIGRSLNPDVHLDQRDKWWLYDDVADRCGPEVARQIWDTWLTCRNRVFHYFVKEPVQLSLIQAEQYQLMMVDTMDKAIACMTNK